MRPEDLGPPPLGPRTWPSWIGIGVLWLLAQLPLPLARPLFGGAGRLAGLLARTRRRVVTRNLELCFPELDLAARNDLRRRFFRSFGIGAFEFLRAWWGPLGRVPAHSRIEGIEHFEAARAAGRGVILLSGHFLPFEMCGRLLTTRTPCAAMYRPYANPAFEWAVKRGRMRYAAAMYGREELRGAVRFLRGGGGLWYAPDQDMRGRDTVFAPFFGVPANTITGTSQLARLSGAAVLPFFHRRSDDGRGYVIRIEPALEGFPTGDLEADATRINALVERMVREAPDQYLWLHRRFKRRPPGAAPVY